MSDLGGIFLLFLKIGALGLGGGYAFLPLIQEEAVANGLLEETDFANLLALAEVTPGPLALNTATFVGLHANGFGGAIFSSFAVTLPGFLLSLALSWLSSLPALRGWRRILLALVPVLSGLIVTAAVRILHGEMRDDSSGLVTFLLLISLAGYRYLKWHPAVVILSGGAAGALLSLFLPGWSAP